jgi:hypothetical protein
MERRDLLAVAGAFNAVLEELHQLVRDKEWYVTDVIDQVIDAKQRVEEELGMHYDQDDVGMPMPGTWLPGDELNFED